MIKSKYIDKICHIIIITAMVTAILFSNGEILGLAKVEQTVLYEKLFTTDKVHTVDIVVEEKDWESMLETAEEETYIKCSIVIDGESFKNVAIRPKGNTSLSNVKNYGNDRYSFKVEFDHYNSQNTYYGLDKLVLNNIIQDNSYMKDFLTYQMMNYAGVPSSLSSFAYITVNGEDWGLYLALEAVEDAFLERNFSSASSGELYKPESTNMGGGRDGEERSNREKEAPGFPPYRENANGENEKEITGENKDTQAGNEQVTAEAGNSKEKGISVDTQNQNQDHRMPDMQGGHSIGSSDTSLIYTDDDYDSYSSIFDNAKSNLTNADKDRLISSIKQLNEGNNLSEVMDVEEVLKYFVVHNFVVNFDSYTGSIIHNYYLYEENGKMSMIPWDYNLAFGTFSGSGQSGSDSKADTYVNYPIDTPVSGGTLESRPMLAQLLANEEYLELYHQYFKEFIEGYFDSNTFTELFEQTVSLISPYVEKDPTAFCTYEEFQTGVKTLKEFCQLRAKSVSGQLDGTISATTDGQKEDASALVDASAITLSDMGGMDGMGRNKNETETVNQPGTVENTTITNENTAASKESLNEVQAAWNPMQGREEEGGEMSMGNGESRFETINKQAVYALIITGVSSILLLCTILIAKKFQKKSNR